MKKYMMGILGLALLLAGCTTGREYERGNQRWYEGPPPHAPARGYYRNHPGYYYYYPSVDVYYDLASGRYFYIDQGSWLFGNSLPLYYYDRLGRPVRVYVPNGYPYYYYQEHASAYKRPRPRNDNRPRPETNPRPENRPRPRQDGDRENPRAKPESRPRPEARPRQRENPPAERPQARPRPQTTPQQGGNNDDGGQSRSGGNNNNRPRPRS